MHLKSSKTRGDVTLRRYQHDRRGIVEILTRGSVVVVRPVFGLVKPGGQATLKQPEKTKARKGGAGVSAACGPNARRPKRHERH